VRIHRYQPARRDTLWRLSIGLLAALTASGIDASTERELIYGSELMSAGELDRYRADMQKLPDADARERYRERHRKRQGERARRQGVELDEATGIVRRKGSQ
jgi:hypothetical protein